MIDMTRPRSRRSNPQTSHLAAETASKSDRDHKTIIAYALEVHGPMTCEEIADVTPLSDYQVRRRMIELERLGAANKTDQTRRNRAGNQMTVYALNDGSHPIPDPATPRKRKEDDDARELAMQIADLLRENDALKRENEIMKRTVDRLRAHCDGRRSNDPKQIDIFEVLKQEK